MNKLLLTGMLIFCSLSSFSTCIAIYIASNGHIYVAADSKRSFIFSDAKDSPKFESVCKIHNVGNNYFAISGFDDGALLKQATQALTETPDVYTAINKFGDVMTKRYKYLMNQAKTYYPDKLKLFTRNGLGKVSFFGFYDGQPNVVNVSFFCERDKHGNIIVTYKTHQIIAATVIGISEDIVNASPSELPSEDTKEQNPALYVEELVKIEAKNRPDAVGAPIDLLELKPDGAVWIRKNENAVYY